MLLWKTDPLLLDPAPTEHKAWVTANELLEQNERAKVFLTEDVLNLYGIFIRKLDFVSKGHQDRIMTRMPYLVLDATQAALIQTHLDEVTSRVTAYFEGSIPMNLSRTRGRIQMYLKQRRLPFPLLRIAATLADDPKVVLANWLEGTIYESFKRLRFKCPLQITPAVAYFLGVCNGDGSLTEKFVHILGCSRKFTQRLLLLSAHLFGKTSKITDSQGYDVIFIKSKWVTRLVHFLSDHPFGRKYDHLRQPLILDDKLACDYWRGVFDADGSCSSSITWITCSERYAADFSAFLAQNKVAHTVVHYKQSGSAIQIKARSFLNFAHIIGTWHPEKGEQLYGMLREGTRVLLFAGPNPNAMTNQGYFDLGRLPKLHAEIKKQRIRIRDVLKLLGERTYEYIAINNAKFAYPRADKAINLPLRPSEEVNEVLKYTTPTRDGITVTTGKHRGLDLIDLEESARRVSTLFGITSLRKSNGGYNAQHKLIRDFLKTFYLYKKPWNPLTRSNFEKLAVKWNPLR